MTKCCRVTGDVEAREHFQRGRHGITVISGLTAVDTFFWQGLFHPAEGTSKDTREPIQCQISVRNSDELWPYQTAGSYAQERLSFAEQWTCLQ